MADVTRPSDTLPRAVQQPSGAKATQLSSQEQQQQQQQQRARTGAGAATTMMAPPTTTSTLTPHPIDVGGSAPPSSFLTPAADVEQSVTKTSTRPVEAIRPAHAPPGAGLAAAVASAVPAAVLRHAPAALAGPIAASAAMHHRPGGAAAAARLPLTAVGRTLTTTWADTDPSVQDLVAACFAGTYAASIGGKPHPLSLSFSSPARAAASERALSASCVWDGPTTFLRGRDRCRVAPRFLSPLFESAVFVPRVVTLGLFASNAPGVHEAAAAGLSEWGSGAAAGGGAGAAGMAPAGAIEQQSQQQHQMPPGLGRIDVEGTLYLLVREPLRRLVPSFSGLRAALVPIDVPVSGVWTIVARPEDDKILSFTDRPANWVKPPRLLRALWGTLSTNVALAFTRW